MFFDDKELFVKEIDEPVAVAEEEADKEVEVDDLLEEDDIEDEVEDEKVITNLKSSIKVADDDSSSV